MQAGLKYFHLQTSFGCSFNMFLYKGSTVFVPNLSSTDRTKVQVQCCFTSTETARTTGLNKMLFMHRNHKLNKQVQPTQKQHAYLGVIYEDY